MEIHQNPRPLIPLAASARPPPMAKELSDINNTQLPRAEF